MNDFFMQRKQEMKCEEFEAIGLDAERDSSLSEADRAAAREHAEIGRASCRERV